MSMLQPIYPRGADGAFESRAPRKAEFLDLGVRHLENMPELPREPWAACVLGYGDTARDAALDAWETAADAGWQLPADRVLAAIEELSARCGISNIHRRSVESAVWHVVVLCLA